MNQSFNILPAVDKILSEKKVKSEIEKYGRDIVLYAIRNTLESFRNEIKSKNICLDEKRIIEEILLQINLIAGKSLKKVINATGILINTNLGRTPFGKSLVSDTIESIEGYSNLEFDLDKGGRGTRTVHVKKMLRFLTGAEDVLIVNNNAAAVMLILRCFAKKKEVIISRGELIEIGGSFRIPDIMKASECKMVEVGTTNKTDIKDYKNSITQKTGLLFKAHKSNYIIKGFTQEVNISNLARLGKDNDIPVVYDMGSGLLRKIKKYGLSQEPNVKEAVQSGADLICFSGDKLLGGPQAGVIVGRKDLIKKLEKEPMYRALRVCKLSIAFLETACSYYLTDAILFSKNQLFKTIETSDKQLKEFAVKIKEELSLNAIQSGVQKSKAFFGGGTLPDIELDSYTISIFFNGKNKEQTLYAEKMYMELMKLEKPVVAILKKGELHFDVLTLLDENISELISVISKVYKNLSIDDSVKSKKKK
ncbi:MAG: L-seryl-tRNA(Sec) selenium transferase [Bacteroidota bacterium]